MKNPLEQIKPERRSRYFYFFLAAALLIMLVMNWVGAPLNTSEAPFGIVSFEFAGTMERAQAMMESWGNEGMVRAAFIQGLDFLFPLVYSGALGLACVIAGEALRRRSWLLAGVSGMLAWGMWLAAGADYLENVALTALLFGGDWAGLAMLATLCAVIKFGLVFLGMVFALYGLVIKLVVPVTSN